MASWREERRQDSAARAEQARQDKLAVARAEAIRVQALADAQRTAQAEQREQARRDADARQARRHETRAARAARLAGLRAWAAGHIVDLLIYPLAVVSAVMAIPAMADYGHTVYGDATGYALPIISELGMWAFAMAVTVSRTRTPDRPVGWLQAGALLFAAVAVGLNGLHGLERGVDVGLVMGVASVAGVAAHQLVTATPWRSRADRAALAITRQVDKKVTQARRAAVRQAVAEIGADGGARLVYRPGRYSLDRRGRLVPATVPGLPVDPTTSDLDDLDRDLARLLAGDLPTARSESVDPTHPGPESAPESAPGSGLESGSTTGGLDTLDRAGDLQESRFGRPPTASPDPTEDETVGGRPGRSLDELRTELRSAVESGSVDPTSAESIRRALRCGAHRARQLRNEWRSR